VAVLTTVFRAELPLWLSYFIANGVAYVAYVEINRGLKVLANSELGRRIEYGRLNALTLLFGGALIYAIALYAIHLWTPSAYRELAKTSYVSLLMLIVALQGARHCFKIANRYKLKIARSLAWVFLSVGGIWSARIISAAAGHGTYAFDVSLINSLIFIALFVTGVIKYLIFPMLLLQKTENDQQAYLRATLIKANKTVTSGGLSASLAHELNQPLTAIRINGQILQRTLQERGVAIGDDVQAMINDILSENDRAAKIITTLRSIFTNVPTQRVKVDSASLIRKALGLVEQEINNHHIQITSRLADGLLVAVMEDEIQQVLLNLLVNSIDALKVNTDSAKREILIESRRQHDKVEISVSDSGPGISKDMQAVLFEILSSSKDSGMGVGLWLSRYIVERHDGQMAYAPSKLGGAMFTLSLPLRQHPDGIEVGT
jgi:signal transduction histidine kinase